MWIISNARALNWSVTAEACLTSIVMYFFSKELGLAVRPLWQHDFVIQILANLRPPLFANS